MRFLKLWILIWSLLLVSCSMQTIIVRQMEPVLTTAAEALYEEEDLQIAEQSLASNLKLIDGLLKTDPENKTLLLLAAQGYAGYALGFAEDQNPERAKKLYLRARDYALKVLRKDPKFSAAEKAGYNQLEEVLANYSKEKVPALFWAGFSWAGYALLSLDDQNALADFPTIKVLMRRVEELNPEYFHGAVLLFWGAYYGMIPKMLGGKPDKALEYFNKNFRLNNERFLLAYVYAAKFYAAKVLDEELFDRFVNHVMQTPSDVDHNLTLFNQIAKQKARRLMDEKEDLF